MSRNLSLVLLTTLMDIVMLLNNFQSSMEIKKKNCDKRTWMWNSMHSLRFLVLKNWLRVVGRKHEYSCHWQIHGPGLFVIPSILLTFDRMRQGIDAFEIFVTIRIFLQFALGSVKVSRDYYVFFCFCFLSFYVCVCLCVFFCVCVSYYYYNYY